MGAWLGKAAERRDEGKWRIGALLSQPPNSPITIRKRRICFRLLALGANAELYHHFAGIKTVAFREFLLDPLKKIALRLVL
jgi:hypothetical protein